MLWEVSISYLYDPRKLFYYELVIIAVNIKNNFSYSSMLRKEESVHVGRNLLQKYQNESELLAVHIINKLTNEDSLCKLKI